MPTYSFRIAAEDFDPGLLPPDARKVGSFKFREAVNDYLKQEFEGFGGSARFVVGKETIEVTWNPDPKRPDPLDVALERLGRGQYPEAVQLLELLRSDRPDDPAILYNLGMALSDLGRLDGAERCLLRLVEVEPAHANGWVALGVLHARRRRADEAILALERALAIDPDNAYALRNLGGVCLALGRVDRAEGHLRRATEINPDDQQAWLGLAQAVHGRGDLEGADGLYRRAIEANRYSDFAEMAKTKLSELAQEVFRRKGGGAERPDAVMYLVGAIERFEAMPRQEVQKVGLEVATLGMRGFDVNDPEQKYELRSLPGRYSGLHCVCLMYAAFQVLDPAADVGFDLSNEYQAARSLRRTSGP